MSNQAKAKPPRFVRVPVSPSGTPLWLCTQEQRHAWIRRLAPEVDPADSAAVMAHATWFKNYEIDDLDGIAPGLGDVKRGASSMRNSQRSTTKFFMSARYGLAAVLTIAGCSAAPESEAQARAIELEPAAPTIPAELFGVAVADFLDHADR